jgi:inosine/xanthosine triphosphate pyrophosphatase family protein
MIFSGNRLYRTADAHFDAAEKHAVSCRGRALALLVPLLRSLAVA